MEKQVLIAELRKFISDFEKGSRNISDTVEEIENLVIGFALCECVGNTDEVRLDIMASN